MSGMNGDVVCVPSLVPTAAPLSGPPPDGPAPRWRRSFPGEPLQVRAVRQWLRSLLPECPALGDVLSVGSELATNAIQHTLTGRGGWFDVEVTVREGEVVRLAVADDGGQGVPAMVDAPHGECGRGLLVVRELSTAYWCSGDADGREIWAEIPWKGVPLPVPDCRHGSRSRRVDLA